MLRARRSCWWGSRTQPDAGGRTTPRHETTDLVREYDATDLRYPDFPSRRRAGGGCVGPLYPAFGGALAENAIWALTPDPEALSGETSAALRALGVELLPFAIDPAALDFPFAARLTLRPRPRGRTWSRRPPRLARLRHARPPGARRCCLGATRRWPAARSTTCASGRATISHSTRSGPWFMTRVRCPRIGFS